MKWNDTSLQNMINGPYLPNRGLFIKQLFDEFLRVKPCFEQNFHVYSLLAGLREEHTRGGQTN